MILTSHYMFFIPRSLRLLRNVLAFGSFPPPLSSLDLLCKFSETHVSLSVFLFFGSSRCGTCTMDLATVLLPLPPSNIPPHCFLWNPERYEPVRGVFYPWFRVDSALNKACVCRLPIVYCASGVPAYYLVHDFFFFAMTKTLQWINFAVPDSKDQCRYKMHGLPQELVPEGGRLLFA